MNIGEALKLIHDHAVKVGYRGGICLSSRMGTQAVACQVQKIFVPSDVESCIEAALWCILMNKLGGTVMNQRSVEQIIGAMGHGTRSHSA